MTKSFVRWVLLLLAVPTSASAQQGPSASTTIIHSRADMAAALGQMRTDQDALDKSHLAYQDAAIKLDSLYTELSKKAQAVGKAAGPLSHGRFDPKSLQQLVSAAQDLQKTETSFNAQYQTLRETMQSESREYTTLSNAMKSEAQTAKNAVPNMK